MNKEETEDKNKKWKITARDRRRWTIKKGEEELEVRKREKYRNEEFKFIV